MLTTQDIIASNNEKWKTVSITPTREAEATHVATRLVAPVAKGVYEKIEGLTGVPWWVVAIIHEREATQQWDKSIAQGDPWNQISRHQPRGRGPFKSFIDAAVDALVKCPPYASKWKDWSPGGALTLLELYNGLGYELYHHEASPYVWAATNHQEWGKYTADGHWDKAVWDKQLGSAALLKKMAELDPSITLTQET